jgi:uncharacterized protein YegP (UPF0339 family)
MITIKLVARVVRFEDGTWRIVLGKLAGETSVVSTAFASEAEAKAAIRSLEDVRL